MCGSHRLAEALRRRGRLVKLAVASSVSHAAWDVHAVHGMHAMHSVSELSTARRLIKLSGQAPDLLPTLVPYARTSDRRSTGLPPAEPQAINEVHATPVRTGSWGPEALSIDGALG